MTKTICDPLLKIYCILQEQVFLGCEPQADTLLNLFSEFVFGSLVKTNCCYCSCHKILKFVNRQINCVSRLHWQLGSWASETRNIVSWEIWLNPRIGLDRSKVGMARVWNVTLLSSDISRSGNIFSHTVISLCYKHSPVPVSLFLMVWW